MPCVLITGANRGLGLEFVRQYAAEGWSVIATCRSVQAGSALAEMQAQGVEVLTLDVGDEQSIQDLARQLGGRAIDVLINNAGVMGNKTHQAFGSIDAACYLAAQKINAVAPVLVTQALLPNLRAAVRESGEAKVIMISSRMGSIGENESGGLYIYRASKAALNAVSKGMALDLASLSIHLAILHPGWVRTDMGGAAGLIDPPQSITGMRRVISRLSAAQSGCFVDYQGKDVAW